MRDASETKIFGCILHTARTKLLTTAFICRPPHDYSWQFGSVVDYCDGLDNYTLLYTPRRGHRLWRVNHVGIIMYQPPTSTQPSTVPETVKWVISQLSGWVTIMPMVDVGTSCLQRVLAAQVGWLVLKVDGHLALFCIHQMNMVNSGNCCAMIAVRFP